MYFDLILNGQKTVEYRANTKFYRRLFSKKPTVLMLHYQGDQKLLVKVKRIRKVPKPREFEGNPMLPTKHVFAIDLCDPVLL